MSWDKVFLNIENILKLVTMIGPMIELVELIFKKVFPSQKKGKEKKELAMEWGRILIFPDVGEEELSAIIESVVEEKNNSGEFNHVDSRF